MAGRKIVYEEEGQQFKHEIIINNSSIQDTMSLYIYRHNLICGAGILKFLTGRRRSGRRELSTRGYGQFLGSS